MFSVIGIVVIFVMGYLVSSIIGIFTELLFHTFMLLISALSPKFKAGKTMKAANKF